MTFFTGKTTEAVAQLPSSTTPPFLVALAEMNDGRTAYTHEADGSGLAMEMLWFGL